MGVQYELKGLPVVAHLRGEALHLRRQSGGGGRRHDAQRAARQISSLREPDSLFFVGRKLDPKLQTAHRTI